MDDSSFAENVDFVVLDSPMGNMEDMLARRDLASQIKVAAASAFNKINVGFWYKEQRVYPQIENTEIPVLVVCSKIDSSIPYEIEESVYNAIKSNKKQLLAVEDSDHSNIYFDHPDVYKQIIAEFTAAYVLE